ncbi:hypothetical protein BP5796_11979 [Coleophoma crateriformis]|uniref:Heterokaryon incompatibility domain-containing protein n=1 Tax=Coleophoma crateriformis TaxID=565419 RepID=A0A3D8QB35_9HELO|nr:hypothetical protein BP5796_11979 [Coleophoma crateriformis]
MKDPPYPGQQLELDDSFRLVELQGGQKEDEITVRLLNSRLGDSQTYEALSYVWGDASQPVSISVAAEVDSAYIPLFVTVNCHKALKRLRRVDGPRMLWIDSICINQSLLPERNHQIKLIPRIYDSASRVVAYLGEGADNSDTAMDWIREIDEPSDFGTEPESRDDRPRILRPDMDIIEALFARRWFSRVWVLQEVRLARAVIVVCGQKEVSWDSFRAFQYWNHNARWVKMLPYVMQSSVFRISPWYRNSTRFLIPYPKRLLKKLKATRQCGATDPRDKLYAIFPLLDWEERQFYDNTDPSLGNGGQDKAAVDLKVNYTLAPMQVYTQLAISLINTIGLSVLREVVTTNAVPELPSWAPDWSANAAHPFHGKSRREARLHYVSDYFRDTTWDENSLKEEVARAWHFSDYTTSSGGSSTQLHARAMLVGTIAKLGDMCDIYGNYFPVQQWESLIVNPKQLQGERGEILPDDAPFEEHRRWEANLLPPFVRALTGDKIIYVSAVERAYERIRDYNGDNQDAESETLIRTMTDSSSDEESMEKPKMPLTDIFRNMGPSYEDQAELIFYNCHGRRFFVTDAGHIGLAPEISEVGDVVMALETDSVLLVARPTIEEPMSNTADSGKIMRLIGGGFVQDVSAAELWDEKTSLIPSGVIIR